MIASDRLLQLMREKNLSQSELGRQIGVSQATIWKMIHRNKIGSAHLHRVARILGTTTEYLEGESEDPSSDFDGPLLTADEEQLLEAFRSMDRPMQKALLTIVDNKAAKRTLHTGQAEYRPTQAAA